MKTACLLLCVATLALGGCASRLFPPRPAEISHVVFIRLIYPEDAEKLIADAERLLTEIPSVTKFACGTHIDTGRETVLSDYDVGLYIGFDSERGYAEYVDDPRHIELVETWRPLIRSMRVFDVYDPTP